jgi:hypothetical protein
MLRRTYCFSREALARLLVLPTPVAEARARREGIIAATSTRRSDTRSGRAATVTGAAVRSERDVALRVLSGGAR